MTSKPRITIRLSEEGIETFLTQVDSSGGPDACWPWTGDKYDDKKYGDAGINNAHRVAFWVEHRRQPQGDVVRHLCNPPNPLCCNPAHLGEGSYKDNHNDSKAQGRTRGLPKGKTKRILTEEERLKIASDRRRIVIVAKEWDISKGHVSFLRRELNQPVQVNRGATRAMVLAYQPLSEE